MRPPEIVHIDGPLLADPPPGHAGTTREADLHIQIFDIFVWVNMSPDHDLRIVRSDIRFRICELFEENNIVIAFPQRDIHVDGSIMIRQDN